MTYRRRASPLHAARAVVGAAWCLSLVTLALAVQHPVVLLTLFAVALVAGAAARVPRVVARACLWGVPFAVLIVLVNALVSRQGLTVVAQVFGLDVTAEALAVGAVYGATAIVLVCVAALYSAAVDPDDLLRALRRVSFKSALTAAIATRMVPVLARDGRRMADAQACRAGAPASRLLVARAVATGAMDRALDVAATLELRGYGGARRPPAVRRPWSRHDLAFATSAALLVTLAVLIRVFGWAPVELYPRFDAPIDASVLAVSAAIAIVALAPFLDRRGTAR